MKRVSRVGLNSGQGSKEKELNEQGRPGQGSSLLWEWERRRGEAVRAESPPAAVCHRDMENVQGVLHMLDDNGGQHSLSQDCPLSSRYVCPQQRS